MWHLCAKHSRQPPPPLPPPQPQRHLPLPYPDPPSVSTSPNIGSDYITVVWAASGDLTNLAQYYVEHTKLGDSSAQQIRVPQDRTKTSYRLINLDSDTSYQICLETVINNAANDYQCVTRRTSAAPTTDAVTQKPEASENVGIIIGAVVGSVIAVVVIIAVLVILIKYRKPPHKKPPPINAVQFTRTPDGVPRTGYDSKRFSRPKKGMANGEVQITTISDGKHVDNSRISAGSYQNINPDAKVHDDPNPYPSGGKMPQGANGYSHDVKIHQKMPFSQNPHHMQPSPKSRYVNAPTSAKKSPAPKKPHYVNNDRSKAYLEPTDHYTNSIDSRPLPKTPNRPLSDNSSGFLNHGI